MDAIFSRFDSYDFEADQRFQDGLKTLNSRDETKLLDLKLFFYNRFVEPIDRSSYVQQSSDGANVVDRAAFSHSGVSSSQTAQAATEGTQLSFAEVMQLVQEGKEVPGVRKLEVKPSNQSPTPSQMERLQKPWETSSASE
eukprot:XP_011601056.1 PREDICTED: uncharacterized protein C6orf226 homolog [Takifugu rubripes]